MTKHMIEYLWYDSKLYLRSKIRFISNKKVYIEDLSLSDIPHWNYDGSSTGQAETSNSEVVLKPVYKIKNPFYPNSLLVICENLTLSDDGSSEPVFGNSITHAKSVFHQFSDKQVWFGLEQEFFFYDKNTLQPVAWSQEITPKEQGKYYCGINRCTNKERIIMDEFMEHAIDIGLELSGINQEVAPSQWEYQIGPVEGIDCAHQMTIAKYILYALCERFNMYPVFHPKPIHNKKWNGSGCHINISTHNTRNQETYADTIKTIMNSLSSDHSNFMTNYSGKDNDKRMSGNCETSLWDHFTYGVADRTASVRIPRDVSIQQKGYFEDRRPASNIDYYKTLAYYMPLLE